MTAGADTFFCGSVRVLFRLSVEEPSAEVRGPTPSYTGPFLFACWNPPAGSEVLGLCVTIVTVNSNASFLTQIFIHNLRLYYGEITA